MTNNISKFELALLAFNVTGYSIGKDIASNSPFDNYKYHAKSTSFLCAVIVGFSLSELLFGHSSKTDDNIAKWFTVAFLLYHILMDIIYQKEIEMISESYFTYYSFPVFASFILLVIGSFGYFIYVSFYLK